MANSSTQSKRNSSSNNTNPPFFPPGYNPNPVQKPVRSERFWFATAMLPLRLFLGVSFLAAGLDKLTDPQFFNSSAPGYIGQQLAGFAQNSPMSWVLTNIAVPNATLFGWAVLFGELAIGLGTLVGLFSRTAAFFGALLSLVLWLSSSWSVVPFFLGPDLPYMMGWITLILVGAHPVWSLDAFLKAPAPQPTAVRPTATSAKAGNRAQPVVPAPVASSVNDLQLARRRFLVITGATLFAGMATGAAWAKTWKEESTKATTFNNLQAGNISSSSNTATTAGASSSTTAATAPVANTAAATTTETTQPAATTAPIAANSTATQPAANTTTQAAPTATPKPTPAPKVVGTKLVALASLPVGAGFKFTTPDTGTPAMVFHEQDGSVKAFSLICTHQGCEVEYYQQYKALACPCHGAVYDITNGVPTQGPARRALTSYKVQVDGSGNVVYVQ